MNHLSKKHASYIALIMAISGFSYLLMGSGSVIVVLPIIVLAGLFVFSLILN